MISCSVDSSFLAIAPFCLAGLGAQLEMALASKGMFLPGQVGRCGKHFGTCHPFGSKSNRLTRGSGPGPCRRALPLVICLPFWCSFIFPYRQEVDSGARSVWPTEMWVLDGFLPLLYLDWRESFVNREIPVSCVNIVGHLYLTFAPSSSIALFGSRTANPRGLFNVIRISQFDSGRKASATRGDPQQMWKTTIGKGICATNLVDKMALWMCCLGVGG